MAFETSVLRDGEWVTETVTLEAALKASAVKKSAIIPQDAFPACAILSRTVIESPIVRWMLPVRLRSTYHNDVAFIGNNFVQISEVDQDGQVHQILRKNDFDLRIRNAVVLGQGLDHSIEEDGPDDLIKLEHSMSQSQQFSSSAEDVHASHLPPQYLALIMESGDLVFLFIRTRLDGQLEFVTSRHERPRDLTYFGHQVAVDPSSRYMAISSPGGILVVYQLKSRSALETQYSQQGTIDPIESVRIRLTHAVVHKLEFLYPRPQDDFHIILMLFVVRKEKGHASPISRLVTYEWELGDSLVTIFAEEKAGIRLPDELKLPLLLVPLKFQSSFFVVSEDYIGVVKHVLSGSPVFERSDTDPPAPTRLHHGLDSPLWTAWSRPFRRKQYFEKTDIIFLAREDGAITHVEIDSSDVSPTVSNAGCIDANIDTAFVATFDRFCDVLITGGESGPGGVWRLAPRKDLEQVSVIPNWSPVVDVATTSELTTWNARTEIDRSSSTRKKTTPPALTKQDRIFSASGRGAHGSIIEWRMGIQARIGLDIETEETIRQSWAFSSDDYGIDGLTVLLSVPQSTVVLQFSEDLAQANSLPAEATPFDLSSSTLYAAPTILQTIVQITETTITLARSSQSSRFQLQDLFEIDEVVAHDAFCLENTIIMSTHSAQIPCLHILEIDNMSISRVSSWNVEDEVTSLSLFTHSLRHFAAVGSMLNGVPRISIHSTDGKDIASVQLLSHNESQGCGPDESEAQIDALTNICSVGENADGADLIAGTRCGHLLSIRISDQNSAPITWFVEKLGITPVRIFPAHGDSGSSAVAFACCDNRVVMMKDADQRTGKFKTKDMVWPTDTNDSLMPSPALHSVYSLRQSLSKEPGHLSLLLIAGSRMLLTDVWPHSMAVPRSIPIGGTPTRIIYSQVWKCLVVALLEQDQPTLAFVDPDSGKSLATATDRERKPKSFISGLGHHDDKVYGLHEWLCVKDGATFPFIVVTTKSGYLIIVSVEALETSTEAGQTTRQLRYWTRYQAKFDTPVLSVVGDDNGILYSVGKVLHWSVLDLVNKKLRPVKEFQLDSMITSVQVIQGKAYALTASHSLIVIDHQGADGRSEADGEEDSRDMILLHTDRVSRSTMHMIDMGDPMDGASRWPVMLLSDVMCGIAGVWTEWGRRNMNFEVLFEGVMPATIRRFVRVRSRPTWVASQRRRRYGSLLSGTDGAEIFGLTVGGSLQHFSLLSLELWRFLYHIQTLAQRSTALCPFASLREDELDVPEPENNPKCRHIDGDLLQRCLDQRALESLIQSGLSYDTFREYLDRLTGGVADNNGGGRERDAGYFALGYDILEYLLAPVL